MCREICIDTHNWWVRSPNPRLGSQEIHDGTNHQGSSLGDGWVPRPSQQMLQQRAMKWTEIDGLTLSAAPGEVWYGREFGPCSDPGNSGPGTSPLLRRDPLDSGPLHHHAPHDADFYSMSSCKDGTFGVAPLFLSDRGVILDPADHLKFSPHHGLLAATHHGESLWRKGAGHQQGGHGSSHPQDRKWRVAWLGSLRLSVSGAMGSLICLIG